jgi:RNA polymerase, alpha subunit C-terminal domain protein
MIPLQQAAILYCTSERNIKNWIKNYQISFSKIGGTLMVDENGLDKIIKLNTQLSNYDDYLEKEVRLREIEISNIISKLDDFIFTTKSSNKLSPVFISIVHEMALLIKNPFKRDIFIDITLRKSPLDVANKNDISVDKVCSLYEATLKTVNQKVGFLSNLRTVLAEKDLYIRKLQSEVKRLNRLIENSQVQLKEKKKEKKSYEEKNREYIPEEDLLLLTQKIETDLGFDTRVINCLKTANIETLEDLLQFGKNANFKRLLCIKNFGSTSLHLMKSRLKEIGVIDEKEYSYLYKYL